MNKMLFRHFVIAFGVNLVIRAAVDLYLLIQERRTEEEWQDYHPMDDYAEDLDDEPDEEEPNGAEYGHITFFEPRFSGSDVDELVEAQDDDLTCKAGPMFPLTVAPEPMPHLSFAPYLEEEDDGDHPA